MNGTALLFVSANSCKHFEIGNPPLNINEYEHGHVLTVSFITYITTAMKRKLKDDSATASSSKKGSANQLKRQKSSTKSKPDVEWPEYFQTVLLDRCGLPR